MHLSVCNLTTFYLCLYVTSQSLHLSLYNNIYQGKKGADNSIKLTITTKQNTSGITYNCHSLPHLGGSSSVLDAVGVGGLYVDRPCDEE